MAAELGMDLIGVDFSEVAISLAEQFRSSLDRPRDRFYRGSFDSIALEDSSISAAMSLDALYLAPKPGEALLVLQRILTSGAPLVFTFYRDFGNRTDWPSLVEGSGFDLLAMIDITSRWRRIMKEKHLRRWERRDQIRGEIGVRAEPELSVTRSMLGFDGRQAYIDSTSRFLLHALRI
jgi:ubiquinone/menaquinone biosynthesis C-methylase UbiE